MRLAMHATFGWRKDDGEFVLELLAELRQVALDVAHKPSAHHVHAKVLHRIELQAALSRADECLSLLAGLAEAGARVVIDVNPEGTD